MDKTAAAAAEALIARGSDDFNRKRYPSALNHFRRALDAGTPRLDVHCYAAHCLFALNRSAEAIRLLSRLAASSPSYLPGRLALADILRWRRRLPEAEDAYREVLRLDPAHAAAKNGLKEVLLERAARGRTRRRWQEAAACLAEAAELDPTSDARLRLDALNHDRERLTRRRARTPRPNAARERLRLETAGLREKLDALRVAGRLAPAERLLSRALDSKDCPAPLRKALLDLLRNWGGLSQAAGDLDRSRRVLEWLIRWAPAEESARRRGELLGLFRAAAQEISRRDGWRAAGPVWKQALSLGAGAEIFHDIETSVYDEGLALRGRGRWAAAERMLRRAVREWPAIPSLRLQLAGTLVQTGKSREAERVFLRALAVAPRRGETSSRLTRIMLLVGLRRYEEAFREADELLKNDRRLSTVWSLIWPWKYWIDVVPTPAAASCFRRQHLPVLSALIERGRSLAWAHYYRGILLRRMGTTVGGAADFDQVARQKDIRPWMFFEVGLSRLYRGDFPGALSALKRTLGVTVPVNWMSHAFLGETLVCRGRPRQGLREFDRACRAAPHLKGDVLAWRGEMHLWLGQYSEALEVLDRAIAAGGRFAFAWRGAAKLRLGRTREALADFDAGVEVWDDVEAWTWRGEAKRLLGDRRGAIRDLNHALRVSPDYWAYANRALAREGLNDVAGMRRDYRRLDSTLTDYVKHRIGLDSTKALTVPEIKRVLLASLRFNAGNRRDWQHQRRVWML